MLECMVLLIIVLKEYLLELTGEMPGPLSKMRKTCTDIKK